jgi:CRP/FNR family transcriptional regulator
MPNFSFGSTQGRAQPVVVEQARSPSMCDACESREASVCAALDAHDLHRLAAAAVVIEADPGKTFITEGDTADNFYNLTRGTVKLYKLLPDGRRQITGFAHRGDFLGLAVSRNYAFSAEAIDHVRYCRFSRRGLRRLLDDFPVMEKRLLDVASNELVAAQEQMLLLGRKTAKERLASFLLAQEMRKAPCMHSNQPLSLSMTRGDIADYLGLTIETVSRTFTRLKSDGLITIFHTDHIVIEDRDGLTHLANGYTLEH